VSEFFYDSIGDWGSAGNFGNGLAYCGNNPVNYVDPYGEDWIWRAPSEDERGWEDWLLGIPYVLKGIRIGSTCSDGESSASPSAGKADPLLITPGFAKDGSGYDAPGGITREDLNASLAVWMEILGGMEGGFAVSHLAKALAKIAKPLAAATKRLRSGSAAARKKAKKEILDRMRDSLGEAHADAMARDWDEIALKLEKSCAIRFMDRKTAIKRIQGLINGRKPGQSIEDHIDKLTRPGSYSHIMRELKERFRSIEKAMGSCGGKTAAEYQRKLDGWRKRIDQIDGVDW